MKVKETENAFYGLKIKRNQKSNIKFGAIDSAIIASNALTMIQLAMHHQNEKNLANSKIPGSHKKFLKQVTNLTLDFVLSSSEELQSGSAQLIGLNTFLKNQFQAILKLKLKDDKSAHFKKLKQNIQDYLESIGFPYDERSIESILDGARNLLGISTGLNSKLRQGTADSALVSISNYLVINSKLKPQRRSKNALREDLALSFMNFMAFPVGGFPRGNVQKALMLDWFCRNILKIRIEESSALIDLVPKNERPDKRDTKKRV